MNDSSEQPNGPAETGTSHHWISRTELQALRQKLREAQETLEAIQSGDVDAVVVSGERGSQIYTLTGAEEPYRVFVEQMREGAVTASESGLILYCNRRFSELLGLPLEKVIGSEVSDYLAAGVWEEITEGMAVDQVAKLESETRGPAGTVPVLITANKLATVEDPVLCLVVTDLSAQKEQLRLTLAKEVAEAANRSKDTFLAVLSHELRTPLTPALMGTYLLEKDATLSPKSRELVTMIRRNVEVETRLIDDLLDLTRITQGKIQLRRDQVDLHAVLREAVSVCQPELNENAQHVDLDLAAQASHVVGDPVRLQQVLWNLIRNASKFSARKAPIFIRSWNESDGTLKISIRDEGVGIEPAILPKLFHPFEQGGEEVTKKFGGLGLGLVISKSIIEMHEGGKIEAASEGADRGSCFTLAFEPLRDGPDPRAAAPEGAKARILLVEDNDDSRMVVGLWLQALGYHVESAQSVQTALGVAQEQAFDILISDIGLPDGSGYELMSQLRRRPGLTGIAMSGYGQHEDVERSRVAGFSAHLVKPVAPATLEAALESALKRNLAGTLL